MRILLDTNILLRLAQPISPHHASAVNAMLQLEQASVVRCLVPQVVYEFWAVATRPLDANGLEMTVPQVEQSVQQALVDYPLLRDERGIFTHWLPLVSSNDVKGKNTHDARLVAAMLRHGVTHLLTFNQPDFSRFTEITVVTPDEIVSGRVPAGLA
jgi:predicted nucleic acid-binding protein